MALNDYYFSSLKTGFISNSILLTKYKTVNEYLKLNDWLFISPIFFQGFELDYFLHLSQTSKNGKEGIMKVILKKFYDLSYTASFIEGYCNRCDHINPFLYSIEHSLILVFQRDFEGAIKTLIPTIEGILRHYLVQEHGMQMNKIRFEDLRKSFSLLKDELISRFKTLLENYKDVNGRHVQFTSDQIEELMVFERDYYNTWLSFVTDFVDNSFYLNTSKTSITNQLNRHAILHEFGLDIKYNLENYIKVYFLLQYLTWIFLRIENKNILNEIESFRLFEKIMAYKKIIQVSEKLLYDKHLLYKNKKGYEQNILREELPVRIDTNLKASLRFIYKFLKGGSIFFWKRFGIDVGQKES